MSERTATEFLNLRLPLYAYTAPLWQGRRVLEIGCGDGGSAEYLGSHGAERVLSVDADAGRVDRARTRHSRARVDFRLVSDLRQIGTLGERVDVVLVPEGQLLLATPALISDIRRLLGEAGHLIVAVPAADRKGRMAKDGVGYYDLADALAERFPVLRMLGQTPFLGFGLVEFDGSADALRVDVSLLHGGAEQPSHYVGIAGAVAPPSLGYSLVQVPFAPVEAVIFGAEAAGPGAVGPATSALPVPPREAAPPASDTRLEMAERRLEESERRARARLEEAETRLSDLRRKLEEALVQAESSVRVSRAQAEEIQELRARIRRGSEDRAAADEELSKLRRALAQADESVLTLTRRTAEEMAVVAEKMVTGLGRGSAAGTTAASAGEGAAKPGTGTSAAAEQAERAELEERARRAEAAASRDHAEIAALTERIRGADEQIRALKQKAAALGERDDRIARLEGDKQDLVWRVAELEEKLRHAAADAAGRAQPQAPTGQAAARGDQDAASWAQQLASARQARDRAIEEFHRGAAAHANEVHQLQSSVAEQAALVAELEDAVRAAEARAAAADKEATTLRRNAKELEEADRARRGRLAELEGKLLRLERERSLAATSGSAGGGSAIDDGVVADLKQRLAAAEQRAVVAEQRATGAEERARALAQATPVPALAGARNGHPSGGSLGGMSAAEVEALVAGIEERLRDEMRALASIEETLARAREEASRAFRSAADAGADVNTHLDVRVRGDLERALAAKDSQLVEGRLELARLRRDSEARQAQLEREISELRARLNPSGEAGMSDDHSQSAQLILMHSTLGNIRRRSARLRDELEGFRRRLDTLPPGALSSMLEEIGEDLAEFAK